MKRSLIILGVSALGLMAGQAYADNYGTAGCGLGAMAFKDKPGKTQIFAATLNNLLVPQTFAISSGTSNCVEDSNMASSMFINVNKQALQKDISRGGGESVAGLSKILKCSDSAQLGSALQKRYESIFPSQDVSAEQINQTIQNTIRSDESLAQTCAAII